MNDLHAAATTTRLAALVAVADLGSVRAAAQALHITPPAVSASIGALETGFGAELLTREGRGVRLTDAGLTVADYARSVLGLLDEARSAVRNADGGTLRIGAVATAAEVVLPRLMASWVAAHPGGTLSLAVGPRDELTTRARHHELDLVVAGRPPATSGLTAWARRANTLLVVAAPGASHDVETSRWLLRETGSGTREATVGLLDRLGLRVDRLTLGTQGAVVAACVAGLGLTLVHADAVAGQLRDGTLEVVPVRGTPIDRPWYLSAHPRPTPAARAFIEHVTGPDAGADAFVRGRGRTTATR